MSAPLIPTTAVKLRAAATGHPALSCPWQTCTVELGPYLAVKARVVELVENTHPAIRLPACPAWTVRDLVAHLAGLCEDWVTQRLEDYASSAWTAAQVERFSNSSIQQTLERWQEAAVSFSALPEDPVMGPPARWAFGDAVTHEADLRGALGADRVPMDAVALALKGTIGRWRQVLRDAEVPTLRLQAPDLREWWLGIPDDPFAVTVEAPAYEVFRALAGRRSEQQVLSWRWDGDASVYLKAGLPYPFRWAAAAIAD